MSATDNESAGRDGGGSGAVVADEGGAATNEDDAAADDVEEEDGERNAERCSLRLVSKKVARPCD